MQKTLKARLHPHWVGGEAGYVHSVLCNGKLLVERSRDPECDAARALLARGITKLSLCDGKTGKPRTMLVGAIIMLLSVRGLLHTLG